MNLDDVFAIRDRQWLGECTFGLLS